MTDASHTSRRDFLITASRSLVAVAVLGTACRSSDPGTVASTTSPTSTPTEPVAGAETSRPDPGGPLSWERAALGSVSAYVLVRSGEVALVDTGFADSPPDIEAVLTDLGLGWDAVGWVVVTHRHPDHVGGLENVTAQAPDAAVYAGEGEVDVIGHDGIRALADGDTVFGTRVVATPGHTAGHISLFDQDTGVLVAGDALNGNPDGTEVVGPNPEFSSDMNTAWESVGVLADLPVRTVLFGHGTPYEGADAAERIAALVP